MRYRISTCILLFLMSATVLTAVARPLTTHLSATHLTVGDELQLTVDVIVPKGSSVTPPATESDFGTITVKEWNVHRAERSAYDSLTYDYLITTYIPEPCTIPQLSFIIEHNGNADTLTTDSLPLAVTSVFQGDTISPMGFRSPVHAGNKPRLWLWILIIAGTVTLLVITVIVLVKHFRKPPPPPPPVPPYEEARDALLGLGVKKYLQRGLVREYVFELSNIFKRYIGRRFECNAMDFTTEEMAAWSSAAGLSKKTRAALDWFFTTTDPVKFARFIPDNDTVTRFEHEVHTFLEETRPIVNDEGQSDSASEAPHKAEGGAA